MYAHLCRLWFVVRFDGLYIFLFVLRVPHLVFPILFVCVRHSTYNVVSPVFESGVNPRCGGQKIRK